MVLDSIGENPPQTPSQRLIVVENLLNVGRGEAAIEYLQPLADTRLTDKQLAALNREFGAAFFLRLIRENALDPIGTQFANRVFEGAARAARDPQSISAAGRSAGDCRR